jgi:hypothetical protein
MFPFSERSIATDLVFLKRASIILIDVISGTARNAPITHHKLPQKRSERSITNQLIFSLFPISFGSMILPVIV